MAEAMTKFQALRTIPKTVFQLHKALKVILSLGDGKRWNLEFHPPEARDDRWYPVHADLTVVDKRTGADLGNSFDSGEPSDAIISPIRCAREIILNLVASMGDAKAHAGIEACDCSLRTNTSSLQELLERANLRSLQQDLAKYEELQREAAATSLNTGRVMRCIGLMQTVRHTLFGPMVSMRESSESEGAERCIVDCALELNRSPREELSKMSFSPEPNYLPMVRVFSLSQHEWYHVDRRDLTDPVWDENALDRVVMPAQTRRLVEKLLSIDPSKLPRDLIGKKHGGFVILARGPSGVGKTLTAEAVAEHMHRPLYTVRASELPLYEEIEDSIRRLFSRAANWNAILLIDEVDAFMQKRTGNLSHDAIAGAFLRCMDYFAGTAFLTTNQFNMLDPAFASRVSICLTYRDLSREERVNVWQQMLTQMSVKIQGDMSEIYDAKLNGREIRNICRVLAALHGSDPCNLLDVQDIVAHRVTEEPGCSTTAA